METCKACATDYLYQHRDGGPVSELTLEFDRLLATSDPSRHGTCEHCKAIENDVQILEISIHDCFHKESTTGQKHYAETTYKAHNVLSLGSLIFTPKHLMMIEEKLNDGLIPHVIAKGDTYAILDFQTPIDEVAKKPEGEAGILMQAVNFIEVNAPDDPEIIPAKYPYSEGWRVFKATKGKVQLIKIVQPDSVDKEAALGPQ